MVNWDDIAKWEETRFKSNNIGKIFYLISWFLVVLTYVIRRDSSFFEDANLFYLYFDIMAILFIFMRADSSYIIFTENNEENTRMFHFEKDDKPRIMDMFSGMFFGSLALLLFVFIWDYWVYPFFPITTAQLDPAIDEMVFQIFRTIPNEEMVFRGFAFTLIISVLFAIFKMKNQRLDKGFVMKYLTIWILAIIFLGILFGVYHIPSYYDSDYYPYFVIFQEGGTLYLQNIFVPVLYLSILGIITGIFYMRYGLIPALYIHVINNLWACGFNQVVIILMIIFGIIGIISYIINNDWE